MTATANGLGSPAWGGSYTVAQSTVSGVVAHHLTCVWS